jgi:hypothetical protein
MKPRHLVGALFCALLLAYSLSVGPVAAWYMNAPFRSNYHRDGLELELHKMTNFYAPILWLKDRVPPLQSALSYYVRLWVDIDRKSWGPGKFYALDEFDFALMGLDRRIFGPPVPISPAQLYGSRPRYSTSEMQMKDFPRVDQQGPPAPNAIGDAAPGRVIIEDHKNDPPTVQP